jgi:hypothetical protein
MSIHSTGASDWEGALVVKPKTAWKMLACSNTRGYELLAAGEITSFLDGRSRKIPVASIRDYIERRLAGANGPSAKTRRQKRTSTEGAQPQRQRRSRPPNAERRAAEAS